MLAGACAAGSGKEGKGYRRKGNLVGFEGSLGGQADGAGREVFALVDVAAHGSEIVFLIAWGIDHGVGVQIAFGMIGFSQLGAREDLHGFGVAFGLGGLDEGRVHVRRLVNLAVGRFNQVDAARVGGHVGDRRLLVAGIQLAGQGVFQLDMDLFGVGRAGE